MPFAVLVLAPVPCSVQLARAQRQRRCHWQSWRPLLATVAAAPLPLSVLLPEKLVAPVTVSVPLPISVPPDSVSDVAVVLAPFRFSVPPLIVVAPSPVTVPAKLAVPPLTPVLAAL